MLNLSGQLHERKDHPIGIGVIGSGKFTTTFLSQARHTPGMRIVGICDLDAERAILALRRAGWSDREIGDLGDRPESDVTWITQSGMDLIALDGIDVVVESTGDPGSGVRHALACFDAGRDVVMVNVEADALAGPLLARRARDSGVVYSLAYGDQPALIVELVDWARTCGFKVVCAGKGTKYLPAYHASTPETVWDHWGRTRESAEQAGMNAVMFNSFLDGTKSSIEMAAVANATGLMPQPGGLEFIPCGVDSLAERLKPLSDGGNLKRSETVEVVSSLERDGSEVNGHLRHGVFVVFEAPNEYTAHCFKQYGLHTDTTGKFAALYRPYHLIGLELGQSIASVVLRREATGTPGKFLGDVVAIAKHDLYAGQIVDGEGGRTVWGRLMPAKDSIDAGALPIGLSKGARLRSPVSAGALILKTDVEIDEGGEVTSVRRELEDYFHSSS